MIVYHLDKFNALSPGQTLRVPDDALYYSPAITSDVRLAIEKYFRGGLSRFGYSILSAKFSPADIDLQILELLMELVRCKSFPTLPSRLQSLFAAPSPASIADHWLSCLRADKSGSRLYACEARRVYAAESKYRDAVQQIASDRLEDPRNPRYTDEWPVLGSALFPPSCIAQAHQYWKHCERLSPLRYPAGKAPSSPRFSASTEFLVQGCVRVLYEVPWS